LFESLQCHLFPDSVHPDPVIFQTRVKIVRQLVCHYLRENLAQYSAYIYGFAMDLELPFPPDGDLVLQYLRLLEQGLVWGGEFLLGLYSSLQRLTIHLYDSSGSRKIFSVPNAVSTLNFFRKGAGCD
jgi:hypothetical protein